MMEMQATAPVVLVVEDEPMLRQVVAVTLRSEGFMVVDAPDGTSALEILQSDNPIDALLTDVRMPGLNGYQLAEAALSLRPTMPVVLMTGYADEEIPESIRAASVPTIRKPFNFGSLGDSLKQLIARRRSR